MELYVHYATYVTGTHGTDVVLCGTLSNHESATVFATGFAPYFYVVPNETFLKYFPTTDSFEAFLIRSYNEILGETIEEGQEDRYKPLRQMQRSWIVDQPSVLSIEKVCKFLCRCDYRIPDYSTEPIHAWKVFVRYPALVSTSKECIYHYFKIRNESIPYICEANIEYYIRYMCDQNITLESWCTFSKGTFFFLPR